jgi:hypothetical protein
MWFWPTTVARPTITPDGSTSFAIDPENRLFGMIVSLWRPRHAITNVPLTWPPERWKPLAALWAPVEGWHLADGRIVVPESLTARCELAGPRPPVARIPPRSAPYRSSNRRRALLGAPRPGDTRQVCAGCGWVLDPIWNDVGRHPGC